MAEGRLLIDAGPMQSVKLQYSLLTEYLHSYKTIMTYFYLEKKNSDSSERCCH